MVLSLLGLLDVIAALVALYSINFGGLQQVAYVLLVVVMLKGLWSLISALK